MSKKQYINQFGNCYRYCLIVLKIIGNKDKAIDVSCKSKINYIVETVSATGKIQPEIEVKISQKFQAK